MGERRHPDAAIGIIRWFIALAIVGAVILTLLAFPSKGQGPGIVNGDFEGEWYYYWGWGTKRVPEGWTPFWDPAQREPEFKEGRGDLFPQRAHGGDRSAQWFNWSGVGTGGLWQQVDVAPGSTVTASAWLQAWTSSHDDPSRNRNGSYWTWIGIDPTGGTDWKGDAVVWSPRVKHYDAPGVNSYDWVRQGITAVAEGDAVTVFVKGQGEWAVTHNDCMVDDVTIEVDGPEPTATPWPTETALPTATPTGTANPTIMPTATPTPSFTPIPTPTVEPTTWEQEAMLQRIVTLETAMDWAMQRIAALEAMIEKIQDAATTFGQILAAIGEK